MLDEKSEAWSDKDQKSTQRFPMRRLQVSTEKRVSRVTFLDKQEREKGTQRGKQLWDKEPPLLSLPLHDPCQSHRILEAKSGATLGMCRQLSFLLSQSSKNKEVRHSTTC